MFFYLNYAPGQVLKQVLYYIWSKTTKLQEFKTLLSKKKEVKLKKYFFISFTQFVLT